MCGIAGFLRPGLGEADYGVRAAAMADALAHRGPDDSGLWVDAEAGVAFGHRRLSIIDLSESGHQPMTSASGRYVIAYNGEVYNFAALRDELVERGHRFRGQSDTEVIVAAIEEWGLDDAVGRFIGMFAFALWDREERTLSLVRDRLGIKPLYWGRFGDLFLFASELRGLRACPGWRPEIDRDALTAYMRWNYVPTPHCIYAGVGKLAPGTILAFRPGGEPTIRRYWDLRAVARAGIDERANRPRFVRRPRLGDYASALQLERLLLDAVEKRMVADVPLGAFLSGGTDSSLVAALMQACSDRPIKTFTIGFHEKDYNEAEHAKAVARHLRTDHTELYVDPAQGLEVVPRLAEFYDEPFADSSQLPTYLVSEMTRRHVTVALSGDGGDELFAGYTRYHWADMVWRRFGWVPGPLRRGLGATIGAVPSSLWESAARLLPAGRRPHRVGERALKLAAFLRQPDADAIYRRQHTHWEAPAALVPGGREPRGVAWDETLADELPDFVDRMQLMDSLTYLPDDILTKVDRASMAVSLEARVPLLDHRVVEFVWRLPPHMKRRDGETKWLLRQVLYRFVPQELIERPKMGFGVPIARWLREPLRDWAEALLDPGRLADGGLLDPAPIRAAWHDFLAGRRAVQEPLWGVLMFQAWRERHLGPAGRPEGPVSS